MAGTGSKGAGKDSKGEGDKLCAVSPTLFTEDFAESNFMASAADEDKPFKTYASMNHALVEMHKRYVPQDSEEAKAAAPHTRSSALPSAAKRRGA